MRSGAAANRAQDTRWFLIGLAVLGVLLAAAYHRGEDSYVRINDHLDGFVPLYKLLADTQPWVGGLDDRVDAIFDGIARNSLPSTLNLGVALYYVLDPLAAHVANEVLIRLLAFLGMALLLRRHLLPEAGAHVVYGPSLCFAALPFLPAGYLSVAGQPLLLHALLNVRSRRGGPLDALAIALFPLYSSIVYTGLFVLLLLGLLIAFDWARTRAPSGALVAAGLLMGALYAGSEYRLLHQTLFDHGYVSHRTEFVHAQGSLLHVARVTLRTFFLSHRHNAVLQAPFILAACAAALLLGAGGRPRPLWEALASGRSRRAQLAWVILACGAVSLVVGLWEWRGTQAAVEWPPLRPIRMFNVQRIQWFLPSLFAVAFALSLHLVTGSHRRGRDAALVLVGAQLAWTVWNGEPLTVRREEGLTFRQYYSSALLDEIRDSIGRPAESYRVVSFGLTPAIPLYNGFYVLDGFVNDYSLEYKRRFRRVIAAELERDPILLRFFDGWGGHLDLWSADLGRVSGYGKTLYTRDSPTRAVERLAIDPEALRELGADYVLSAVEIRNHRELGMTLEGTFAREDAPWEIRVYSLGAERRG